MPGLAATHPSAEDYEDFVLHARYGDLADLQSWLANFGREAAAVACDENDNTALHMAAANGHEGLSTFVKAESENADRSGKSNR